MTIRRIRSDHIDLRLIKCGETEARQAEINVGLDELTSSIVRYGLLNPVLLVEHGKNETYELIVGQRRLLAYQNLAETDQSYSKIHATIYENTMEEWEKRAISISSNITQEPLKEIDKINAITAVYSHFDRNIPEMARTA